MMGLWFKTWQKAGYATRLILCDLWISCETDAWWKRTVVSVRPGASYQRILADFDDIKIGDYTKIIWCPNFILVNYNAILHEDIKFITFFQTLFSLQTIGTWQNTEPSEMYNLNTQRHGACWRMCGAACTEREQVEAHFTDVCLSTLVQFTSLFCDTASWVQLSPSHLQPSKWNVSHLFVTRSSGEAASVC
jgi:hypothetical protein